MQIDADVRLLWRFPSRRVEAEVIRDTMLEISGLGNREMYGRGFDLFNQRGGLSGFTPLEVVGKDNSRRTIYAHKIRREKDSVFGAFDCPDAGQSTAKRRESLTPIQALNLFNSRLTLQVSEAFANRLKFEASSMESQIDRAFELALTRSPTEMEKQAAVATVKVHGLHTLCRVLFNCNEFLDLP